MPNLDGEAGHDGKDAHGNGGEDVDGGAESGVVLGIRLGGGTGGGTGVGAGGVVRGGLGGGLSIGAGGWGVVSILPFC